MHAHMRLADFTDSSASARTKRWARRCERAYPGVTLERFHLPGTERIVIPRIAGQTRLTLYRPWLQVVGLLERRRGVLCGEMLIIDCVLVISF